MAVVEGVTEFLPISSTGHLILTAKLLAISQTDFVKSFEIAIQLGAIGAVMVNCKCDKAKTLNTLIAFIPTGILGLMFYKLVKTYLLGNSGVVLWALLVGGVFIVVFEFLIFNFQFLIKSKLTIKQLTIKQSLAIGFIQSLSMIPGVSRAMMSIFGGMAVGLSRREATEFSFLLAIPTMAAATGWDLLKSGWNFSGTQWWLLVTGFIGAFISAFVVVKWLIGYVQKHDFTAFGVYRIILALLFLLML